MAAQDRDDPAFWAAMSVDERVLQVWRLSEAQWHRNVRFGPAPAGVVEAPGEP